MYDITVFTPTYNRAYILPKLYQSLLRQEGDYSFEWLIIDDGSTDETEDLVKQWLRDKQVVIHYHKVSNGGKPRAINQAVALARSPFLFIVDSDDYLSDDALSFIMPYCRAIEEKADFVGVGILRGNEHLVPKKVPLFKIYVDATNLQRVDYALDVDCNEVYKVEILRKYPFEVWEGEVFIPEAVVFNEMALDGYKLRWCNKVAVISEYLQDGMTKGGWGLMKRNPMGYAMMFNHQLKYQRGCRERFNSTVQMICHAFIGGHLEYLKNSNDKLLTLFCFPLGLLIAARRMRQYRREE